MYSLHFYGEMIANAARTEPYVEALRKFVTPESVVLDLGCGQGLFALLACRFGARRVYAIEPDNAINIGREAAVVNGCADRIEFFQSLSTEVPLPEPATIAIFDLRGVLPWFQAHIPSIVDARQRLLAPDRVLIPRRDVLWAALVETPEEYEKIVGPWRGRLFDVDLSAGLAKITNSWRKTRLKADDLLTEEACWTTLDYRGVVSADVCEDISWRVERSGTAHGIAAWFDADLADGIGFTNRPGAPELVYGQAFFPFPRPVDVSEGERVNVRMRADFVQNDYVWSWTTDFADQQIGFEQSTFYSVPLSVERLRKSDGQ